MSWPSLRLGVRFPAVQSIDGRRRAFSGVSCKAPSTSRGPYPTVNRSVSPARGQSSSERPGRRHRMLPSMNRRRFLQALGAGALVLSRAIPARAAAQGDRLVVAVGQWGIETPFAWRSSQSEKTLWDCLYDPLIMRDPKTFEYRPGLATDWQPSADY